MKIYFVEPPRYDYDPDGLDTREWFSNRADAEKRFTHWKRECLADINDELTQDEFAWHSVKLGYILTPLTKAGLLRHLSQGFHDTVVLKTWTE